MSTKPAPLSSEQISHKLQKLSDQILELCLDLEVLRDIVLEKRTITKEDLARNVQKVRRKARDTAARVADAIGRGPGKSVQ